MPTPPFPMTRITRHTQLPAPACTFGYTEEQVREICGPLHGQFQAWMGGQTVEVCEGRLYDHATKTHVESCEGIAHGPVVSASDLQQFLSGGPSHD